MSKKKKTAYDGSAITHSLAHLQEQQMWRDMDKVKNQWNEIKAKVLSSDNKIGKVIMVSTVDESDSNIDFKKIWNESNRNKGQDI